MMMHMNYFTLCICAFPLTVLTQISSNQLIRTILFPVFVLYIPTEQRNCEILKLLQIYKNDQKSKFMLTYILFKIFLRQVQKWLGGSHAYYAYDVWKERGVSYSFTHLVGGLFIAGIGPGKA